MLLETERQDERNTESGFRVMVVDDQSVMRKIIRKLLKQFGDFDVIEAENGSVALDRLLGLDEDLPDVIISDLHMDVMDGLEFCNKLRRIKNSRLSAIPVVLLTGENDKMVLDVSAQVGASRVLKKPVSAPELQRHLSEVVGFHIGR